MTRSKLFKNFFIPSLCLLLIGWLIIFIPVALALTNPPTTKKTTPELPNRQSATIQLPILMYHYVEPLTGKEDHLRVGLTTPVKTFDSQLQTLQENHYQTYFAKEIPSLLSHKQKLAKKSIVLTFDDGYEDFYTYVFPLLKKYHFKATNYVIYDAINAKNYLTDQEIKELIASGLVEIGSHTLDHTNLITAKPAEIKKQIFLSKTLFEKRFRVSTPSFAYPFGALNETSKKLVEAAGYQTAMSTRPGLKQNLALKYQLPRLRPGLRVDKTLLNLIQK